MQTLTRGALVFSAEWVERNYWMGASFLDAIRSVKRTLGLDDVHGDRLQKRMEDADQAVDIARRHYEYAASRIGTVQRAMMLRDIEGKPTWGDFNRVTIAQNRAYRLRAEYREKQKERDHAAYVYSRYCCGVV